MQNRIKVNTQYNNLLNIFFVMAFFDFTYTYNIYIVILLILFILIILNKFDKKLVYALPLILLAFLYLIVFSFGEFYRFEKTFLLIIPIVYVSLLYEIRIINILKYFLHMNILFIYIEFIYYILFGSTIFPNTTSTLEFMRYHSFFQDSNFFSYTILIYIIFQKINTGKYNVFYIGSLLLSLSISAIGIFIIFIFFFPFFIKKAQIWTTFLRVFSFILITAITFIYYFIVMNSNEIRDLSDNQLISFKLESMARRFDVQSNAINLLIDQNSLLLGLGNDAAKKSNTEGLNLHNTYLQIFLESGFITILLVVCFIIFMFWSINILFVPILSVMFLLGNIMEVFYFPLLLFIFFLSKVYENNLIRRKKSEIFFNSGNIR